jgi:hypothetical protein
MALNNPAADGAHTSTEDLIKQKGGRRVIPSAMQATVVLNGAAPDLSLPSVVVPSTVLPPNAVITAAYAAISWRKMVDSSGSANAIVAAAGNKIEVDITGGFVTTAILLIDNVLSTEGNAAEGGGVILGILDIKAEVAEGSTTLFQWSGADVDAASLTLHDVQTYIIVEFE